MSGKSLVVISPPGGIGEVTAVKAAAMGNSVKWFVVGSADNNQKNAKVVLSPNALEEISKAGGSVELAGANAESLLGDDDEDGGGPSSSAIRAVRQWCANASGLVCTTDGTEQALKGKIDEQDPRKIWEDAIKVAAQEAGRSIEGLKVAVLSAGEDDSDQDEEGGGLGKLLKSVVGKNTVSVPSSLGSAMAGGNLVRLRHGDLFGIPESSVRKTPEYVHIGKLKTVLIFLTYFPFGQPNFSALAGGPRKDAMLCEEYTMRSVRMDPSLSVSGNIGTGTRSSRHAVGEAAALIALQELPVSASNLDVCVSSQVGTDPITIEMWEAELKRVEDMLKSGQGAQLFTAEFSKVPDVERLADWLATKWAPAVLRTYDIAAIRVGARPVYASRTGQGKVEVVWQQLDNFESVTVGKMLIQVSNDGLVATRAPGDATKGYGDISKKPLNGESVLVRRLVDAASQAVEKGLAVKVRLDSINDDC
jgi:hypothetical protein